MNSQQTIIARKGSDWQHNLLMALMKSKDFPTRIRLFNAARRLFNLDLLSFRTPSGLKLLIDFDDWVQGQIYHHGNYEPKSVAVFKSLAKESTVILDLGSHIGQYALECAQEDVAKTKQIIAVEVNPKTFTYLLNNIQLNNFTQVKPVLGALYNDTGILNIDIPAYWNMGNTQISGLATGSDSFFAASFSIQQLLKKFDLQHIDLVKLDVEGQEYNIIKGFFDSGVWPGHFMFEHIPEVFTSAHDVVTLLQSNGYRLSDITGKTFMNDGPVTEQNLIAKRTN